MQATAMSPQKFSRYRSVRIAAVKEVAPPPQVPGVPVEDAIKRSMSRYRNTRPGKTSIELSQVDVLQPPPNRLSAEDTGDHGSNKLREVQGAGLPDATKSKRNAAYFRHSPPVAVTNDTLPSQDSSDKELWSHSPPRATQVKHNSPQRRQSPNHGRNYSDARQEAYAILSGEMDRIRRQNQQQVEASERAKQIVGQKASNEDRNNIKRGLRYPHGEEQLDGIGMGHRRANTQIEKASSQVVPQKPAISDSGALNSGGAMKIMRNFTKTGKLETSATLLQANETRDHSVLPGIDAPLSAVNAGERKVLVKCNHSKINLPVTPSTTASEVLHAAAKVLAENIDTNAMILLEFYKVLGLERPVRQYEHVRDVLNSWDQDDQNSLLIVPSTIIDNTDGLALRGAPAQQPKDTSFSLYHSQKPGTWDKRWITLRADGQVLSAKEKNNLESKNICHLSDFDIYIPTSRQMRRVMPPKRYCFAVKSQQKSIMFLSTANFVHFFATKDKALAESWYKAVQEWRSWHLVHVMGNGQKTRVANHTVAPGNNSISNSDPVEKRHRRASMGSSIHHTGTPKKLTVMDGSGKFFDLPSRPSNTAPQMDLESMQPIKPTRHRGGPPVSFPKNFKEGASTGSPRTQSQGPPEAFPQSPTKSAEGFSTSTNLLGRTFSQRQRALQSQASNASPPQQSNDLARSPSKLEKAVPLFTPLVDLTPKYQELPQYIKKGRGVVVTQIPVGGLVEMATSPDVAVPVPPATTWRRPGTSHGNGAATQHSVTMPDHISPPTANGQQAVDTLTGGLLTRIGAGQGTRRDRKDVTAGLETGKPLLDVQEPSKYIPGSLLASVEKHMGSTEPVIDREKRKEAMTSTGEGNQAN